ncbi:MAG: helix-turn-helix domain-containing protein [Actinobacteria bacterium]|nr:helix-turn-helix domain-containing protein [Actinomycetota bacterium]
MSPTVQEQARALGHPTRHAIYRFVVDAGRPVGVAELTAHFQLNHNAIRQHLAKLVDAGLVLEHLAEVTGPGRRRLLYGVNPAVGSAWGPSGPYERLSLLLSEMIRTGDGPVEVGRRAGRAAQVSPSVPVNTVADIAGAMEAQGFDPAVRTIKGRTDVVLQTCPFQSTALADPDIVCRLHLGMAEGLAQDTDVVVEELVAHDPRRANCVLRIRPRKQSAASGRRRQ